MMWLKQYVFVVIAVFSAMICIISFVLPWCLYGLPKTSHDFDGSFSLANSVVSFFAFAFLIYTLHLQHADLGLQRAELTLQRQEMQRMQQIQMLTLRAQLTAKVPGQTSDGRRFSDDELLIFICESIDLETEKLLKEMQPQVEAISAMFRVCHYLNRAIATDSSDAIGVHLRTASRWARLLQDCKFKSLYVEGNEKTREVMCIVSVALDALDERLAKGTAVETVHEALRSICTILMEVAKELISEESKRNPRMTQTPPDLRKESRAILEAAKSKQVTM